MYGKLHPTQEKLLRVLAKYDGVIPSLRDLGRSIRIQSASTIAHHLHQLELKGYLIPEADGQYKVMKDPIRDVVYLPLFGNAACGVEEFFANENVEDTIPLPARALRIGPDYFLVQARGDSMEPKIHDRDLLLVRKAQDADSGQIVLAALDDGVFAKRLLRGKKETLLYSLNPTYRPVTVEAQQQFRILGQVRGVLRSAIR